MKLILVIGILARLLMLALFDPNPLLTSGDAPLFITQHGFGLEPPGYPLFLAFLFPLGPWAVILVQMALTISVALFTYARTKLLWLALAIVACPYFIIFELKIYTEALVCALVWVALVLLCWPRHKWEPALAGLLLGLATLTRDTLYLMPLLIPIFAIRTKLFKPALIACLTAFLIVLPWQIVHGGKISEGRGGFALWIGTWETNPAWMLGGLTNWPEKHPDLLAAWQRHDDAPFTKAAIEKMRAEPLTVIKTWAVRYPRLWIGTRTDALQMRIDRHAIAWFALKAFFFTLNSGDIVSGADRNVEAQQRSKKPSPRCAGDLSGNNPDPLPQRRATLYPARYDPVAVVCRSRRHRLHDRKIKRQRFR